MPPRSEVLVLGSLEDSYNTDETWGSISPMNEVSRSLPKDILVGRTLVNLKSPAFPVRVVNVSDSTRGISKATELAKCKLV